MTAQTSDRTFVFLAGSTWLDFINTELIEGDAVVDLLGGTGDLVAWVAQANLLDTNRSVAVEAQLIVDAKADEALHQAKSFRRELRTQAERFAAGKSPTQAFINLLNNYLAAGARYPRLQKTHDGFDLSFRLQAPYDAEVLLSLIAESAALFLATGQPERVKCCEDTSCILFFYDTSKNHARRWCSMAACGNRAKAKAHYGRKRHTPNA